MIVNNPVKKWFPPPVTWPGIMLLGALGSVAIGVAFPAAVRWVASKIPVIQKSGSTTPTNVAG